MSDGPNTGTMQKGLTQTANTRPQHNVPPVPAKQRTKPKHES